MSIIKGKISKFQNIIETEVIIFFVSYNLFCFLSLSQQFLFNSQDLRDCFSAILKCLSLFPLLFIFLFCFVLLFYIYWNFLYYQNVLDFSFLHVFKLSSPWNVYLFHHFLDIFNVLQVHHFLNCSSHSHVSVNSSRMVPHNKRLVEVLNHRLNMGTKSDVNF